MAYGNHKLRQVMRKGRLFIILLLPLYTALFATSYYITLIAVTPVTLEGVFSYQLQTWDWVIKGIIILPPAWIMARIHGLRLAGLHKQRHLPDKVKGIKEFEPVPILVVVLGYNIIVWAAFFLFVAWIGREPTIPDWGYDLGMLELALLNFPIGSLDRSPDEGGSLNQAIDEAMEDEVRKRRRRDDWWDSPVYSSFVGNIWHD